MEAAKSQHQTHRGSAVTIHMACSNTNWYPGEIAAAHQLHTARCGAGDAEHSMFQARLLHALVLLWPHSASSQTAPNSSYFDSKIFKRAPRSKTFYNSFLALQTVTPVMVSAGQHWEMNDPCETLPCHPSPLCLKT